MTSSSVSEYVSADVGGEVIRGSHTFLSDHTYKAGDTITVNFTAVPGARADALVQYTTQRVTGINNYTQGSFLYTN